MFDIFSEVTSIHHETKGISATCFVLKSESVSVTDFSTFPCCGTNKGVSCSTLSYGYTLLTVNADPTDKGDSVIPYNLSNDRHKTWH